MVTVLMPGQSDETACVRISAALSEVTKQKLGFSVSIEQVAPTNYSAELWKRMVCQTMPDLFFLTENQPLDVELHPAPECASGRISRAESSVLRAAVGE